jgi:RNA polymerase sigma-70 factor (ECF subfamily)
VHELLRAWVYTRPVTGSDVSTDPKPPSREAVEAKLRDLIVARQLQEAASLAIRAYGPEILGYIHSVTIDPVAASDIYSQFAEDFWTGLSTFEPRAMVRTWAFRVARSAIARYFRDPYRRKGRRLNTGELDDLVAETTQNFFSCHTPPEDKVARLRQLLSPEERELLHLRVDREMSWNAVVEITGDTPAAARKKFQRIREKVRGAL